MIDVALGFETYILAVYKQLMTGTLTSNFAPTALREIIIFCLNGDKSVHVDDSRLKQSVDLGIVNYSKMSIAMIFNVMQTQWLTYHFETETREGSNMNSTVSVFALLHVVTICLLFVHIYIRLRQNSSSIMEWMQLLMQSLGSLWGHCRSSQ